MRKALNSPAAIGGAGFLAPLLVATAGVAHAAPAVEPPGANRPAPAAASSTRPSDIDRAGQVAVPPPPPGADLPPVDPIIPDGEFDAAIPSTAVADDPELAKPLESIDAFERRVAGQQSAAAAGTPTVLPSSPVQVQAQAQAAAGPSPVTPTAEDAELAKPLPPLNSFQVEPVQLAGPEPDQAAKSVRYAVRVNGIEIADKDAASDLAGEFKRLSALKGGGKADNSAMVAARLTEDSKLMQQLLASEGWYSPTVTTRLDLGDAANNQGLVAVIKVAPGKRYALSEITVNADPTVPPDLIASNLALKVGEPIVAERVQGAEAQIAVALPQNGYPFAKVGQRDILLDQDTGQGAYTLPVTVGVRGRFGDFATVPGEAGKLAFDADHVRVLARYKRGELYDSRKVDDLRQALVATGLFSTVTVQPKATGEPATPALTKAQARAGETLPPDDTQYVTTLVTQNAGPPRTIAATVGYGSGEGFTAQGTWTHRNLFPPEGALIAGAIAGTKQQGASVIFRRSNAGQRDRTFELAAQVLRSTYDAYNANTARLAVRMSRDSTPIWQKKYTWAVGAQVLGSREQVYDFALGRRDYKTYFIGGISGQLGVDFSDSLLNPTRGFRVTTLIEPEGSIKGGFTPYVRARIDASGYYPFGGFVLAGRVRFGTIQGATLDDLAPSRRFYAGGGGSVRGYAFQKLGQLDANGDPIGGRSLTEGSVEVRYRFGNYGVVGFVDAGQSYASTKPQFSDLRYGVGIGGRFYTNFGPLRLDVATPLGRRRGEGRLNVYVSIGQAF